MMIYRCDIVFIQKEPSIDPVDQPEHPFPVPAVPREDLIPSTNESLPAPEEVCQGQNVKQL